MRFSKTIRKWAGRLGRTVAHEIWNIGIVRQTAADVVARGIVTRVQWLADMPRLEMLADPSCRLADDGSLQLFAEFLDYRKGRGEIWSALLPAGTDLGLAVFRPLLQASCHMSYPMPFRDLDGSAWLMVESWQSAGVKLWRLQGGEPIPAGQWLRGLEPVDPTLLHHGGRWYLFCTLHDDGPDDRLHIFHADRLDGCWQPVMGNPVRTGRFGSRPAGPIMMDGPDLVRPGQDCSETYGGGVVLHRILRLDPGGYEEEFIRRLGPVDGPFAAGLHTICAAGTVTLIDGKRWQLDLAKPARQLIRRLARRARPHLGRSATGVTAGVEPDAGLLVDRGGMAKHRS